MSVPRRTLLCAAVAVMFVGPGTSLAAAQTPGIDPAQARQYFDEAKKICEDDGGKLWGKTLCGPMLFVDPQTHAVATNQPDTESRLKPAAQGRVFVGALPTEMNVANTAMTWAGVRWTMVMWPLPENPTARDRLLMHESFHRIQEDLGLPLTGPANVHLATLEGRVWLRLEWRALQQALARPDATSAERKRAVEDALLFRLRRRALFPKAAQEERELEMNEGLAEYTGYKLRGTADSATVEAVMARLGSAESDSSFSRSFAYVSGPAYGLLLDLAGAPWRKGLTGNSDLGDLLRQAYQVELPADLTHAADDRSAVYDGAAMRWSETQQEEQRLAAIAAYKKRLVTGPVLSFPLGEQFSCSFDPNTLVPLDDTVTAFPMLRASDTWGVLEVSDGALMARGPNNRFVRVVVEAPKDGAGRTGEIGGNGWKLTLSPGWTLLPGDRPGDLRPAKQQ